MNLRPKIDLRIFVPAFFLYALGVTTIYSVAPQLVHQQLFFGFLGILVFLFFSSLDYQIYKNLSGWFWLLAVFFLILTEVVGVVTRGSVRWLDLGIIRLQPSELIKPAVIIYLATNFERNITKKKIVVTSLLFLLPMLLILRQPDLGNTIVFAFLWLTIFFLSGVRPLVVLGILLGGISLFLPIWKFLKDYQRQRIITFLNPGMDPLGSGYNAIQSTLAVGAGEFFGRGLGRGTQSHLLFLPEYHTDFIFASFAEEWGFVGVSILLIVYFFLLQYLFKKANTTKDRFGQIVLIGIIAILFIQMFINIGMNMGIVPITGITLPLISYGGSSLISTAVLLGIASNITQQKSQETTVLIS